ncbi:kelch-like protein 12 [Daktulosphaira vitifoliae]|uniref:kelch-like protein 12 n=1 Tax=Daktulosphaira vitifoliae TaxID=58002 RepID=UPI0021AA0CE4|nr:kelch-like protein 12 [Daktulosphaira vitifoliae]XP_050524050.1 kelch-like protein 12 [Daktulosphaira vitifoliae]XP_050524051.1 kelch-like protein 12 [Daktulosphaira vitifoliae]XP_050524052.1 kelch-like protein 12 [Daktulosphaira vitifoliae]
MTDYEQSQTIEIYSYQNEEKLKTIYGFLDVLESFRQSRTLCDVTLVTNDDLKIPAHKVILAAASPVFLSMFNNDFKESKEDYIPIRGIDSDVLKIIMSYLYTYHLEVNQSNVERILKAVDYLDLNHAKNVCYRYIEENISPTNCINFMKTTEMISNTKLYDYCFLYTIKNISEVMEQDVVSLYELSSEDIIKFISNNHLEVKSEMQVFNLVINWIKYDEDNRQQILPELMNYIRLPQVPKEDLEDIYSEPLLVAQKDCLNNILMEIAKTYTSSPKKLENYIGSSFKGRRRTPLNLGTPEVIFAIRNIPENDSNFIEYLDTTSNSPKWKIGVSLLSPQRNWSQIVSTERGTLYAIGGVTKDNIPTTHVDLLDLTSVCHRWTPVAPMHIPRKCFAVCIHKNNIFVVGGAGIDGYSLDSIEIYDINLNRWNLISSTMNIPREFCSAAYHDGFIYVIGGITNNDETLSSVERYEIETEDCVLLTSIMPLPKYNTCVAKIDDLLYVIGGVSLINGNRTYYSSVHAFNLTTHEWILLPNLYRPRSQANVVVINKTLYVFGGFTKVKEALLTTEMYDARLNRWKMTSNMQSRFKDRNAITISKKLLQLTGISDVI